MCCIYICAFGSCNATTTENNLLSFSELKFFFILSFTLKNVYIIFLFWMQILPLKYLQIILIHWALEQLFTKQSVSSKTLWEKQENLVSIHSEEKSHGCKMWKKILFNISHFFYEHCDFVQSKVFQRKIKKPGIVTWEWYILFFFSFKGLWRTKSPLSKWSGWLRRKGVHAGSDTSGSCSLPCCRFVAGVYIQHPDPPWN